ncbi:MAG: cation diffusion facilitator CzcD-associated flavoprotein CzcO [Myxococcota bacterium]|jgi:cation diffusion facilitator CzcD-associated flavoprotein CzcO
MQSVRTRFTIIGAGAGGLCAGIKLLEKGQDDFLIFDRAPRVGGTWHRNTYPGLQCDIAAHLYCYSFAPNPDWSSPFPPQPEIQAYLEKTAFDHGLKPYLRLGNGIASAQWNEATARWQLVLDNGDEVESQFVISAVGMFGASITPKIPGLDTFEGTKFHSAHWKHDHDLSGERIAVIGSAASAVQFMPEIAPDAEQLHVFQRTPNWVLPKGDTPFTAEQKKAFHDQPELMAESRQQIFDIVEKSLTYLDPTFFQIAEDMGRRALEAVEDPTLRKLLTPEHPFGSKRPLASNKYLQCFNRDNVELVTDPIERITPKGVITADGRERKVDTLLLATGFETQKYASVIDFTGREGLSINDAWANGPEAYFGVTTHGFPNLFSLYGPNTNGGNSIILMLEFQIAYALRLIDEADGDGVDWLDVRRDVMDEYNAGLQDELNSVSVWQVGANDYYRTASGRIVTQWPHCFGVYKERVDKDNLSSFETGRASA